MGKPQGCRCFYMKKPIEGFSHSPLYMCLYTLLIDMFQLLPKHTVQFSTHRKKAGKKDKKDKEVKEPEKPGQESARKNRENFTRFVLLWSLTFTLYLLYQPC